MSTDSAAPPRAPQHAATSQDAAANRAMILVVDDDAAVRTTVTMQLERLGYTVCEADGAEAALRIIDGPDKVDLLFTDVIMPGGMNGKQLAAAARRRRSDLPILFTSGFPGPPRDDAVTFDGHGMLLSKPYRKQELARAVREMLATRR